MGVGLSRTDTIERYNAKKLKQIASSLDRKSSLTVGMGINIQMI